MMAVGREARTSAGCQWQWQRTWLDDLVVGGGGRLRRVRLRGGEAVFAGEIVAEDGLEVAVGEEAAGLEIDCVEMLLGDGRHQCWAWS